MKLHRLRIAPTSAWRTPWQADTVAGLLCWMLARTEGPEALERELLGPARQGRPPFVLSDAFPEDLFPVPTALRLLPIAAAARKHVKRARWLRLPAFRSVQRGALPDPAELLPEHEHEVRHVQIRNTLDRERDSSMLSGGVFSQPESLLGGDARFLTLYARITAGWEARLFKLFEELATIGYGADSSTGKGQFDLASAFEPFADLDDVREPNTAVSLSTFQPDPRSRLDGAWDVFTKYGKLGPDFGMEDVFKRPLVMLRPGACLRAAEPMSFAGRFLAMDEILAPEQVLALRDRGVDVGHLAYGLTVPACLAWDDLLGAGPPSSQRAASASPRGSTRERHVVLLLDIEDDVPEEPILALLPPAALPAIVLRARSHGSPVVHRHGPGAQPVEWASIAKAVLRMAETVRDAVRDGPPPTFWISGRAPLPAFVQLGMLLSAWAGRQVLVNRRKDGTLDVMPLQGVKAPEPFFDVVSGIPDDPSATAGRLAVFVSTGLLPERDKLRTFILEGGEPFGGLVEIRAREPKYLDETNAAAAAEELARHLSRIPGTYPRAQDIALFVAGPASLAFIAGRAINPNVLRSTWVANRTGEGPSGHELAFVLPLRSPPEPEHAEEVRVRVEELRLSHFRAMEDARLVLNDLTMLVGRNGAGKTTVAEALDFLRDALTEGLEIALERRGGLEGIRQRRSDDTPRIELPAVSLAMVLRVSPWPDPGRTKQNQDLPPADQLPSDERVLYGIRLRVDPVSAALVIDEVLRTTPGHVSFERYGSEITSTLAGVPSSAAAGALVLPLVADLHRGWRAILDALRGLRLYTLSPAAIRNEPPIGTTPYLLRDGGNAGDVMKAIESDKADTSWLVARLAAVTPGLTGVRSGSQARRRTLSFLQLGDEDERSSPVAFSSAEVSDGTLRALGVLLAFRQRPAPSLVFIDEIEDSVHPAALAVLLDAAKATTEERCQVVLTSHSPEVLSHPAVTGDNVRIVTWRGGRSRIHLLSEGTRASLVPDTVGDLLRINALEPDEAPLRVEGDVFAIE